MPAARAVQEGRNGIQTRAGAPAGSAVAGLGRGPRREAGGVRLRLVAAVGLALLGAWLAAPVVAADDHGCDGRHSSSSGPGDGHQLCPVPATPARALPAGSVPPAAVPSEQDAGIADMAPPPAVQPPDFQPAVVPPTPYLAQPVSAGELPPVRPALAPRDTGPDLPALLAAAIGLAVLALAGAGLRARWRVRRDLAGKWPDA